MEDQLPGGKFYSPSAEIFAETKTTPKHNIICERDFAHLDRKLKESPQISSVGLSGVVYFINNKTPHFQESLSPEERHKYIERAISEKKGSIKKYQEMEERRQILAKQSENKEKRKEQLDLRITRIWGSVDNTR